MARLTSPAGTRADVPDELAAKLRGKGWRDDPAKPKSDAPKRKPARPRGTD